MSALHVLATGPLTTVQDLGRPGLAHLGVGPSGAADRTSLRQANRLLGNDEGAAALEVTLGGLRLRAEDAVDVVATGSPCGLVVAGREHGPGSPVRLDPGDELELTAAPRGLRCYLAVRGGLATEPVLGSRSADLLAGVGPGPLAVGDRLPIGVASGAWPGVDAAPWLTDPRPPRALDAVLGPRDDWFDPTSITQLGGPGWVVSGDADRSAVVLAGPRLGRSRRGELAPEGMVRGAIQVPPGGRPTVLLADHPVTGGYPVIAVLHDADVDRLAQLRPGDPVALRLHRPGQW